MSHTKKIACVLLLVAALVLLTIACGMGINAACHGEPVCIEALF